MGCDGAGFVAYWAIRSNVVRIEDSVKRAYVCLVIYLYENKSTILTVTIIDYCFIDINAKHPVVQSLKYQINIVGNCV